ncbi:FmdB family zinc ribbon protein [Desulfovibrio legallii]|uniref:Putative regulatory protein, FmdB family n=1 Tax=Desulfovibrio legallii TaxID=571438 RepID=A0A1G7LHX8_9BACT|nr:zinc ribbon domain-containing protein [Desulfovibrio legallii]SDF49043.1 putative regulatory protein, FmdB family [Desulfovibrio legallii]
MPIYEYSCTKCGRDFEELVFDDAAPVCPHCGSHATHKLMSCCAHHAGGSAGGDYAPPSGGSGGGGCAGCSGGNCASCGH